MSPSSSAEQGRKNEVIRFVNPTRPKNSEAAVTVATALAIPPSMVPGADSMAAPSSFTARRPNASNLPNFELPPPQLPAFHQKHTHYHSQPPTAHPVTGTASVSSVGNLLTPPSGASSDGLSPPGVNAATNAGVSAAQSMSSYSANGYSWPQPGPSPAHYTYQQQSSMSPSAFNSLRAPFSPSLSSIVKNSSSPHPSDGLSHSSHSADAPHYSTNMSTGGPLNLPSIPIAQQQQMAMVPPGPMSAPLTHQSPVTSSDAFRSHAQAHYHNAPHSAHPAQTSFGFSNNPSPVQQSPISGSGPMARMSPAHAQGQIPSLYTQMSQSPYGAQRPFSYPGPAVGGMNGTTHQMHMAGQFASGMQHMYAQAPASAAADRPFKCDQCPQSFNRNHDLKRHKRIHLAVKPFPCGHCEKSFSRKDALKRHILVKGCGKSQSRADADKASSDGSDSPSVLSDQVESSPVITATA